MILQLVHHGWPYIHQLHIPSLSTHFVASPRQLGKQWWWYILATALCLFIVVAYMKIFHKPKEETHGSEDGWYWWPLQQSQVPVHRLASPTVLKFPIQKLQCLQIKVHRVPSCCKMNLKFLSCTSWGSSHLPTYQDRLHLSWYIQQKRMGYTFFPQILHRKY